MRILIVTDQFPPKIFGGMAQHAWYIAHQLSQRHTIEVLIPKEQQSEWGDLPFKVSALLTNRFPAIDAILILWKARVLRADVIHVCNAALSYRIVSRFFPMVTRVVGNDFLRPWCGYRLPLHPLLYRLPAETVKTRLKKVETKLRKLRTIERLQQVDVVVANSAWTRKQLLAEGISEQRVCTIVGGVDTSIFRPTSNRTEIRQQLGLPDDGIIVLTVANLVAKKGIDTVLAVVSELLRRWPSLYYVIVGDGQEKTRLKEITTSLGIENRVLFAGKKPQRDLVPYYQAADIYAQVSVETMGRTYMEAGACSVPVIAARVGGVLSVVRDGENGLLISDPQNLNEIKLAIRRLIEDSELRRQLGCKGLKMAQELYSWERVSSEFEAILVSQEPHQLN